jgi:Protein tyrosine and serine/threonine kinase
VICRCKWLSGRLGFCASSKLQFAVCGAPVGSPKPEARAPSKTIQIPNRYPDFVAFLAICFKRSYNVSISLHPVLTSLSPDFDDINMSGGSFDVRRVRTSTLPHGLNKEIGKTREFVITKHSLRPEDDIQRANAYADIASNIVPRNHDNIIRFLSVMYHDAGDNEILPALILEFAEFGSVKSYQEYGYGRLVEDKLDILLDAGSGLQALHEAGIIHGYLNASNLLVCKHQFVVKFTSGQRSDLRRGYCRSICELLSR